jgi:hypothetical protein
VTVVEEQPPAADSEVWKTDTKVTNVFEEKVIDVRHEVNNLVMNTASFEVDK